MWIPFYKEDNLQCKWYIQYIFFMVCQVVRHTWALNFHVTKELFLEELCCVHRRHMMKSVGSIYKVMAYILV
jgi:hypothetical protein